MKEQHTTPEQMLDLLGDHCKLLIGEGFNAKTEELAPLLEIYFKYTICNGEIIPRAQRKDS